MYGNQVSYAPRGLADVNNVMDWGAVPSYLVPGPSTVRAGAQWLHRETPVKKGVGMWI